MNNEVQIGSDMAETEKITRRMVEDIRDIVKHGTRRWRRVTLLRSVGFSVSAILGYLWLAVLTDSFLHLAVWSRVLLSAFFLAGIGCLVWRVVRSWRAAKFTEDQVALAIENRTPGGLQNRLINAVQLSRVSGTSAWEVHDVVVRENYRFLQQQHLRQSTGSGPAIACVLAAMALIFLGAFFWAAAGRRFTNSAGRILLPLADIAPLYRTVITVEPGDVTAAPGDDVAIMIRVRGHVPSKLFVLSSEGSRQISIPIALDSGVSEFSHVFRSVRRSMTYAARGGDFMTPYYRIDVPMPLEINKLAVLYRYPEYTRLPPREIERGGGDIEALIGSTASITFFLNQDVDEAWLCPATSRDLSEGRRVSTARVALKKIGPSRFAGDFLFGDIDSYHIEARREGDNKPLLSAPQTAHVLRDQSPNLHLTGVERRSEFTIDAVLPLELAANDDYGLTEVGLFYRSSADDGIATDSRSDEESGDWKAIGAWTPAENDADFECRHPLIIGALGPAEGDRIDIAVRARDTDPVKQGVWTTGPIHSLTVTGPDSELQILYERILRSEADLARLVEGHESLIKRANDWIGKLSPASDMRWDDAENAGALSREMLDVARIQSELRGKCSLLARDMVEQAGESLRVAVGMLADTEMARGIRIVEKVPERENLQAKRGALADARMTQERIVRSLGEILADYKRFREDWELFHMPAFVRMLAKRQQGMAETSVACSRTATNILPQTQTKGLSRRQFKILDLTESAQKAFEGMAAREETVGATIAAAFKDAHDSFDGSGVKTHMRLAGEDLESSLWSNAAPRQVSAADALNAIDLSLRHAKTKAAREALAGLQELAESDVEAQKEIEKLKAGASENLIRMEDNLKLEDVVHVYRMADALRKKHALNTNDIADLYVFDAGNEDLMRQITTPNFAMADINTLKLGDKPSGQWVSPGTSDTEANRSQTSIQEKFEDLVGDLLEEADDLRENYETYNINTAWGCADPGTVSKQAGDINGTGATSTTGNMKPPTANIGGASRSGRQGARAHGLVVGDESINRRGRDEAQEGQQEVAEQPGTMKETLSDDPQKDTSTGTGGKEVGSKHASFSVKDAGEWKDEMTEKLRNARSEHKIVERKGKPLAPDIAEMMRDLTSCQEQLMERIKIVKKELDNLYLPTDHLDEIMNKLNVNLDRLREAPAPDVFREQIELIDRLKGEVVVFNRSSGDSEESLARDQIIRGRVLDEPAALTIPGYEDAVNRYYQKLSGL